MRYEMIIVIIHQNAGYTDYFYTSRGASSVRPLSFLSKLMLFAFVISTLPVLFIGSFSYLTSSNEIQKNVNKSKMELILQINSNVEHKLATVNQTLNQVVNSSVLKGRLTTR